MRFCCVFHRPRLRTRAEGLRQRAEGKAYQGRGAHHLDHARQGPVHHHRLAWSGQLRSTPKLRPTSSDVSSTKVEPKVEDLRLQGREPRIRPLRAHEGRLQAQPPQECPGDSFGHLPPVGPQTPHTG